MIGTSIKTPTTVARDAPEDKPKNMADVVIATSKWLDATIMEAGAAFNFSSLLCPVFLNNSTRSL